MSGAGLGCSTSLLVHIASNRGSRPAASSFFRASGRRVDVATARGIPRACRKSSISMMPGRCGTPAATTASYSACERCSTCARSSSPTASSSRWRQTASLWPTIDSHSISGRSCPRSRAASARHAMMARSLSSISPSMSKTTAMGVNGNAARLMPRLRTAGGDPPDREGATAPAQGRPASARRCGCDATPGRGCRPRRTCGAPGGSDPR